MSNLLTYIFLFMALYFEVFMLVTYLEHKDDINEEKEGSKREPKFFPSVSIIAPCWNEATTLGRTVDSLLALNYPKDKLDIILVDDGSTDDTWEVMNRFESSQVRTFRKKNGGKHTALNLGLSQSHSDLVGCLDADSYADKDALKNIVLYFEDHPEAMSVTPSVRIWKPKNLIQTAQAIEYVWAIFLRKMLSYVGAIYVTPGPFSIFRREVFMQLGPYREAHRTEDMELAVRMQSNHMVIGHAHTAVIHTSAPDTVKKLYKQRLRWTYGFVKNSFDYRFMFFKREYGTLGLFIFPIAALSLVVPIYAMSKTLWSLTQGLQTRIVEIRTVGFHLPNFKIFFDWYYLNTTLIAMAGLATLVGTIVILLISKKIADGKSRLSMDLLYFLGVSAVLAPIWIGKALYNAAFSVTTNWR